jgi:hypothetical protein
MEKRVIIIELEAPTGGKKDVICSPSYISWCETPMIVQYMSDKTPLSLSEAFYNQVVLNHQLHEVLENMILRKVPYLPNITEQNREEYLETLSILCSAKEEDKILMQDYNELDQTYAVVSIVNDEYDGHGYFSISDKDPSVSLLHAYRDRVDAFFLERGRRDYIPEDVINIVSNFARGKKCNKLCVMTFTEDMKTPEEAVPRSFHRDVFEKTTCDRVHEFFRIESIPLYTILL